MEASTEPTVMCAVGTTIVALKEEVHLAMLKVRDGYIMELGMSPW
ncbi:hypothetical protein TNCT_211951, partial [Trichonephila clavata]